jgi:hypothetical protein
MCALAHVLTATSESNSGRERFEPEAAVAGALITGPARHQWLLSVTLCWCEHVIFTLAPQNSAACICCVRRAVN